MNDDMDRRRFIRLASLGTAGLAVAGSPLYILGESSQATPATPSGGTWPPDAARFRFYMVAYAHTDAVWLWPWEEAMAVVLSTFRSMLDRMKTEPHFAFSQTSAQFYKWAAENDPEMVKEIRQRVEEGRWNLIGGWWIEPDVNMPNGESLARQGLYGQRVVRELFGRRAKAGANPDSFGHPATLPQILKLQELEDYMFARPEPDRLQLPADLFWWEGADGTRILGNRLLFGYGEMGPLEDRLRKTLELHEPVKDLLMFYGAGDHGGGATDANIASMHKIMTTPGAPQLIYSTPDQYFAHIRSMNEADLPVYQGEMQHFAVGCYTAVSQVKKDNRTTEAVLTTAEKIATVGSLAWNCAYPDAEFHSAWEKVLLQQFHDSLAGSARPEHYVISHNAFGYAQEVADQATALSLERLEWQVPTEDPESDYLVVFNPHAWATQLEVEYDLGIYASNWSGGLIDERGLKIPHQYVQASEIVDVRSKLVFQAPLPAFGYRQFRVLRTSDKEVIPSPVHANQQTLENEHLRVGFTPEGTIGIFDKNAGEELFQEANAGMRAVVLNDPSDTWTMLGGVYSYPDEIGAFADAQMQVLEEGPFRGRVRTRTRYGNSFLEIDWILYAGSRTLEARCQLDWHEHLKMLKLSFPVRVAEPRSTYEIAFGHIERPADGIENPGHRWIDLTGKRGNREYGLAVINDAKYGYSVLKNDMRVSIVRSPVFTNYPESILKPDGAYLWQDQGIQKFRLWLVPHAGSWQDAGIVRLAEEYTAPVPVQYQGIHGGSKPQSGSFLSVDAANIVVTALKKADEGNDDLILRCYETEGRPATATLDLKFLNRQWSGSFRPLEIKTLRIPVGGGTIREVNLLER
jgi:alpha-mannosidase